MTLGSPPAQPRVLVAVASRHGATAEIGDRIAEVLRRRELVVDLAPAADEMEVDVAGYDALVVGSAVYAGRWLSNAREFVEAHQRVLAAVPVWMFSSGPVGEPPTPEDEAVDVEKMTVLATARDHRVFGGRIDKSQLGMLERAVVVALRAPEGDFRPWPDIEQWAETIADSLVGPAATDG